MKKALFPILALILALGLAITMAAPVAALESKTIYRQNGFSAYADWSEKTDGVYTYTFLSLTETKGGTDIYVEICKYNEATGYYSCMRGYKFTEEDVFDVDNKLTTAILSPVKMDLCGWDWEDEEWIEESITIQSQWTGIGKIGTNSFRWQSKSGDFMAKYSSSSKFREAVATGSINDEDLGNSSWAGLVQFRNASMTMKK